MVAVSARTVTTRAVARAMITMPPTTTGVTPVPAIIMMIAINYGTCYITVVAAPVIGITYIAAVTNNYLVMTAAVSVIMIAIIRVAHPWVRLVYHHFVTIVNIIITIPYGQIPAVYPNIIFIVHIAVGGHIIIGINIGHVIVIHMIVTYRPPIGLAAYINT